MNIVGRVYVGLVHAFCLGIEALAWWAALHASQSPTPSPFDWVSRAAAGAICIGSILALLVVWSGPGSKGIYLTYTIVLAGIVIHTLDTMEWIGLVIAAVYGMAVWPVTMIAYRSHDGRRRAAESMIKGAPTISK